MSRLRLGNSITSGSRNPATSVEVATERTESLQTLLESALKEVRHRRGGEALLVSLFQGETFDAALDTALRNRTLYLATTEQELSGFALIRDGVICALFVEHSKRRHGIARAVVTSLIAKEGLVLDALALPGDRATKSLYESIGWKARLLTMRAE